MLTHWLRHLVPSYPGPPSKKKGKGKEKEEEMEQEKKKEEREKHKVVVSLTDAFIGSYCAPATDGTHNFGVWGDDAVTN